MGMGSTIHKSRADPLLLRRGDTMELPLRFPREADVIYEQAQAYRRLPPIERLLAILDLIASGMALLEHSPHREASLRLRQADEEKWQHIQQELFARHAP